MIDGEEVVHELVLAADRQAVFDAWTDPAKLVRWIGIAADLEPRPGGRFRFEVMPGQFCEGAYLELDPPARLVVSWGWSDPGMGVPPGSSRVELTLTAIAGGTRLRLVHRRLPGPLRAIHDDGWTRFLVRLRAVLAGADPGAYPDHDPRARRAALAEEGA